MKKMPQETFDWIMDSIDPEEWNDDDCCTCQFNDCPIHGSIDPLDHEEVISSITLPIFQGK